MIGDYEKVGWSTENPVPLTGYNLQKVDEKLDEIDKHLLSINTLSGVLQGPPGITVPNIHELEQLNEDLQQSDELIVYDTSSDSHKKTSITDVFSLVDTIYVKETNYKDIDVLNKIKNVDGDGSGLNADLLDGYHGDVNDTPNTYARRTTDGGLISKYLKLTNNVKVITGNYTIVESDDVILVNTTSAVTITLPPGLYVGKSIKIGLIVSASTAVTVVRSGSETIEGGTSFEVIGATTSAVANYGIVTLTKVSSTAWWFTDGVVSGSNSNGNWIKFSDGTMIQRGKVTLSPTFVLQNYNVGTYGWSHYMVQYASRLYIYLPTSFYATDDYQFFALERGGRTILPYALNDTVDRVLFGVISPDGQTPITISWLAIGRWKQ